MSDSEHSKEESLSDEPYYADDFETGTDDEELLRSLATESEIQTDAELSPQSLKNICAFVRNPATIQPRNKTDIVPYNSSSDEEDDVVVGVAVAEINAKPKEVKESSPATSTSSPTEAINGENLDKCKVVTDKSHTHSTKKFVQTPEPALGNQAQIKTGNKELKNMPASDKRIEPQEELQKEPSNSSLLVQFPNGQYMRVPEKYIAYWEAAANEISSFEKCDSNISNHAQTPLRPHSTATCRTMSSQKISCTRHHRHSCPLSGSTMSFRSYNDRTCHNMKQEEQTPQEFELEIDAETDTEGPFDVRISSSTPEGFNSGDHVGEVKLVRRSLVNQQRTNRKSWSFSNERVREIDRHNQILLNKILSQKPPPKPHICSICTSKPSPPAPPPPKATLSFTRLTSAAVNRKKQQRQIDQDNQILQRKIEAILRRKPAF